LQTFNDPTVTVEDEFGYSVAIDGNNVLIGAQADDTNGDRVGQAHLFDATTGNLLQTFDDPTVTGVDLFGRSVAIDGNYVLVGAQSDNTNGTNVGQAHLFDATTGNLLRTFDDPTVTSNDFFGNSVAIDGNNVLIGANGHDTNGTNSVGQAHLFDATTGNLLDTFDDPTGTNFDNFGFSVAIDGDSVLIGAPFDNTMGNSVGQAHLFTLVFPSKSLISGPLIPDGMGGLEPITDVEQGPFIAIGVRDQHWAFEISIIGGDDNGGRVYVDALPSGYEVSPFFEDLETDGCPDGVCDGIGEELDCPVTVTPPRSRGRTGQTLIAIEPDGLDAGDTCTTTVYVNLRQRIRSCPTAALDDGTELNYTFPFNDGVQCFDAETLVLVAGPFDPIRFTPVGCPAP
jgi:hypothetical protein